MQIENLNRTLRAWSPDRTEEKGNGWRSRVGRGCGKIARSGALLLLLIRYQSLTQVAPYPDGLRVGTSVFKVPHSPMLCLISPGSIRRSAYGTQISFYRKRQSDRARSLPLFHTLQRLKKENKSHSLVGRHKRS
ncbi:hypothetical protein F2P81_007299 [Scophthalmus maximus]|uniref:Uncharacterized protein n=1 Tax=Scophthalmus maximus TaxID=52904 RepID=A0A6A4TEX6_SCOMX|nr:hypothetical protein F2P81_007299 [Scophthalmus maximus]